MQYHYAYVYQQIIKETNHNVLTIITRRWVICSDVKSRTM